MNKIIFANAYEIVFFWASKRWSLFFFGAVSIFRSEYEAGAHYAAMGRCLRFLGDVFSAKTELRVLGHIQNGRQGWWVLIFTTRPGRMCKIIHQIPFGILLGKN